MADRLPVALLGLLFVLLGLFIATQANSYGRTYDEELQDDYGRVTLDWYTSFGQDRSFLEYDPILHMPEHGPFFETVVAAAQSVTGEQWTTRAVVTALGAVVGIAAIALCGYELASSLPTPRPQKRGGWWMALLSAAGLASYPRYFGAMFNNSKDVPFTAAMIVVLWLVLRLMRRWKHGGRAWMLDSALVGCAIGAAASIRVIAVIWYALLALLVIRQRSHSRKLMASASLIGGVSMATMCVLWPYILLNPPVNLARSVDAMSKYPWGGMVPFDGHHYSSFELPRRYVIEWLVIGSPLAVVTFAVLGGLIAIRNRNGRILFVGCYLAAPVLALIVLRSTMYNGPRHFLFVIPALILLASYGLLRSLALLARRGRWVLVAAALVAQAQLMGTVVALHPYEYSYFSPVVGGLPGAAGRYELDYWGTCNKAAADWLAQHHSGQMATVDASGPPFLTTTYLPPDDFQFSDENPDYYVWSIREWVVDKYPSYRTIHEVTVQGYAMCVVKERA